MMKKFLIPYDPLSVTDDLPHIVRKVGEGLFEFADYSNIYKLWETPGKL